MQRFEVADLLTSKNHFVGVRVLVVASYISICSIRPNSNSKEWQTAIEVLLLVAEHGGPTMLARIGVMRALSRHVERVFNPDRKEHHWGRRKLARDR
jgi:hypothetical protein